MILAQRLDRLHARAAGNRWLGRLELATRILLFLAFLPSGLKKVLDVPFTILGPETSVGYFFDAIYRAGFYYEFLGWAQLLAGTLLLFRRTLPLGALVYFPIILNIWVITVAMHFAGTWVITSGMLVGNVFLLCMSYDRLRELMPWAATAPAAGT